MIVRPSDEDESDAGRHVQRPCSSKNFEEDTDKESSDTDVSGPTPPLERAGHLLVERRRRRTRPQAPWQRPREDRSALAALELANEVEELRRRRDELTSLHFSRVLNSGRPDFLVSTALEYYDTFRSGFHGAHLPAIAQYMNSRIDRDNFTYGAGGHGMTTWVEQWRRYMRMFPSIAIRVRATSCMQFADLTDVATAFGADPTTTACLVEARGTMNGVISRQAVHTILPHIRNREDLLSRLVGAPLDCPMNLRFYFNEAGRVIRLDFDADFFQAFCNVTQLRLAEVAEIMGGATIGENSLVPAIVELDESTT